VAWVVNVKSANQSPSGPPRGKVAEDIDELVCKSLLGEPRSPAIEGRLPLVVQDDRAARLRTWEGAGGPQPDRLALMDEGTRRGDPVGGGAAEWAGSPGHGLASPTDVDAELWTGSPSATANSGLTNRAQPRSGRAIENWSFVIIEAQVAVVDVCD